MVTQTSMLCYSYTYDMIWTTQFLKIKPKLHMASGPISPPPNEKILGERLSRHMQVIGCSNSFFLLMALRGEW